MQTDALLVYTCVSCVVLRKAVWSITHPQERRVTKTNTCNMLTCACPTAQDLDPSTTRCPIDDVSSSNQLSIAHSHVAFLGRSHRITKNVTSEPYEYPYQRCLSQRVKFADLLHKQDARPNGGSSSPAASRITVALPHEGCSSLRSVSRNDA